MGEQTNPTKKTVSNEETIKEVNENTDAEQTITEEGGSTPGKTKSEQVDFSQMYDMLTERDKTIKSLQSEVAELKKTNTGLLLKVNAASGTGAATKDPFESFIDSMVKR